MKICVINDNTVTLRNWEQLLSESVEVITFSHISRFLEKAIEDPKFFCSVEIFIADRCYYRWDLLMEKRILASFFEATVGARRVLSSSQHVLGDSVDGFDLVLPQEPLSYGMLCELLGQ